MNVKACHIPKLARHYEEQLYRTVHSSSSLNHIRMFKEHLVTLNSALCSIAESAARCWELAFVTLQISLIVMRNFVF